MLPVIVVGLGDPGKKYAGTRHNVGFMAVERLAEKLHLHFKSEDRFFGRHAKGEVGERTIHLLLPETYMNESGKAVQALARFTRFLLLKSWWFWMTRRFLSKASSRKKGSAGGHNGLRRVLRRLWEQPNYPRLKLGIGDEREGTLADHVLSCFNEEERVRLP